MTTSTIPPGHLGNLTPYQEHLVQHAWTHLLRLTSDPNTPPLNPRIPLLTNLLLSRMPSCSKSTSTIRHLLWNIILADHPDAVVLRFLRARKWNMPESLSMLASALEWRNATFLDTTLVYYGDSTDLLPPPPSLDDEDIDRNTLAAQYRTGKAYTRGVDRQGRPVLIIRVRLHDPSAQTDEAMENFVLHNIETMRTVMTHTDTGGGDRDRVCLVFDLSGFSLRNMDLHLVKFLARVFEARYPETLGIVLVHQAPVVFGGVWKMIRPLLDPVIASKIKFTKTSKDLQEFIAPENLQTCYGGQDKWEYQYLEPVAGENGLMKTAKKNEIVAERDALILGFERLTAQWISLDPVSTEARQKNAERGELIAQLRESFWRSDPYMRARTHYHRLGVIDGRGGVDYKAQRCK